MMLSPPQKVRAETINSSNESCSYYQRNIRWHVCVFVYHKTIRPKPLQLGVQIIHVSKCYTGLVAAAAPPPSFMFLPELTPGYRTCVLCINVISQHSVSVSVCVCACVCLALSEICELANMDMDVPQPPATGCGKSLGSIRATKCVAQYSAQCT